MEKIEKIAEALCKAQSIMSGAKKIKINTFFKSSYCDLESVFDAIREPFTVNGLSISQTMDILENGRTVLKTMLMHLSGQYIESKMVLPDIIDPQKLGSAITYYRRYSLMAISGISSEDDDGNLASTYSPVIKNKLTKDQVEEINDLIDGDSNRLFRMLKWAGVSKLEDVPSDKFDNIKTALSTKLNSNNKIQALEA